MSPGALPTGDQVIYWAYSSKFIVLPKMESCFQDGACPVCFLLQGKKRLVAHGAEKEAEPCAHACCAVGIDKGVAGRCLGPRL